MSNSKLSITTFIGCDTPYDQADIVLFGAPFDGTTSFRPGTRFGPNAIRTESIGLETYSPYCERDLTDHRLADIGDLELPFGNPRKVLDEIRDTVTTILEDGKLPFMIGGEHLVTLGSVEAVVKRYADLHIVHFDAHADLRQDYLGEPLSHATVLRRCYDLVGDGKISQFGIRSMSKEEDTWAKDHVSMHKFTFDGLAETVELLKQKNCSVYITIDLDVLDPSVFPGTGTPEAGGVSFQALLEAMKLVCSLPVVGIDVNELSPHYDSSGASTAVGCKVVRELLLLLSEGGRKE